MELCFKQHGAVDNKHISELQKNVKQHKPKSFKALRIYLLLLCVSLAPVCHCIQHKYPNSTHLNLSLCRYAGTLSGTPVVRSGGGSVCTGNSTDLGIILFIFKAAVRSTEAFIMSPTRVVSVLALLQPCDCSTRIKAPL